MSDNGMAPPESADKQLGEIVSDVTSKAQLLVREEIELAKAEVTQKVSRIGKGVAAFGVAAFFALMMLVFALHTLAWALHNMGWSEWVGYGAVTLLLLLLTLITALVGLRLVKKGTPPAPELAIEEAKKTKAALDEARR